MEVVGHACLQDSTQNDFKFNKILTETCSFNSCNTYVRSLYQVLLARSPVKASKYSGKILGFTCYFYQIYHHAQQNVSNFIVYKNCQPVKLGSKYTFELVQTVYTRSLSVRTLNENGIYFTYKRHE